MSRDSLQMGEQSRLRHCRDNNLGVLSGMFNGRSHGSAWTEGVEFWEPGYG